jgi:hypothetical protein
MKSESRKGLGCLVLFALPFLAGGLFAGYRMSSSLWLWLQMRSWVEVPAELVWVDLETHDGSDSTTYEVKAEYRYAFEGVEHRGTRVGVHEGSDNVGEYHEDTYRELSRAKAQGAAYRCFVDPFTPSRSVLDRDLRLGLVGFYSIFVIAFGGVGAGLIVGGIYGSRRLARENELKARSPEKPWLHKEEWRTGKIPSTKAALVGSVVFAVLWNSISAPLLFLVPRELARGNVAALLGLLFPAVGAGLLLWAAKHVGLRLKFGESVLELRTMPGVIGGRLEGVVRAAEGLRQARAIEVQLSAIGRARVKSGDGESTEETLLWETAHTVPATRGYGLGTVRIPVSFEIPGDLPPTDETDARYQIVWRLDVRADVPGLDYAASFDVPVFRTAESEAGARVGVAELSGPEIENRLKKAGVRIEPLPGGKRFLFSGNRSFGTVLSSIVFVGVVTFVAVVLFYSDAPRLFPWAAAGFDAILLLAVLDSVFHSSRLEVVPGAISIERGWLGRGEGKRWSTAEVESIRPTRGPQSGKGLSYRLELRLRSGKTKKIARGIPDRETAESLAKEVEATLRA